MRVVLERHVREIIDRARISAEQARHFNVAAESRLHVIKSAAREAGARVKKLRNRGGAAEDLRRPL